MKRALLVLLMALPLVAQEASAPEFKPTPGQADKLEIASQRFQIAALQLENLMASIKDAKEAREQARQSLVALCGKVSTENKWPEGVTCTLNAGKLQFVKPEKTAAAK